ncbi:hypothetical protein [Crocosphaera sp. XPORK-15E]|uniref:ribonuclease toxin HepT-like protein n=1 Tax=Crocosphaera sp. XPORK-15E TaxID=3110247 RepID=UPI002B220D9A|nr:hypothetical protein [Crocosphaera sp. XPORK-15E]MEA5534232.1 hypothetical protein [Crocosphaera sp. XPORK-15E]
MNKRYQTLSARIKQELIELEKVVNRAKRAMNAVNNQLENQDLFLDSVALSIHDFYTGLERVFSQIATVVDNFLPSGQNWHRELLNQMGREIDNLRPQIFSAVSIEQLDEYRRFRHVVRNVYGFEFEISRIEPLVIKLEECFTIVKKELLNFAELLEVIAQ